MELSDQICKVYFSWTPVGLPYRYPFTADQEVQTTDWEQFIVGLANDIISEQSPQKYVTNWCLLLSFVLFAPNFGSIFLSLSCPLSLEVENLAVALKREVFRLMILFGGTFKGLFGMRYMSDHYIMCLVS